jgi:hypothetical protein
MSKITDKYLMNEQYVQSVDIGMHNILNDMIGDISDLYKHLKKYEKQKDMRVFANVINNILRSYETKFNKWKKQSNDILSNVNK